MSETLQTNKFMCHQAFVDYPFWPVQYSTFIFQTCIRMGCRNSVHDVHQHVDINFPHVDVYDYWILVTNTNRPLNSSSSCSLGALNSKLLGTLDYVLPGTFDSILPCAGLHATR